MPGESYGKQLRSLLCLCDIFRALINSLVYWVIRVRFGCCFVVVVFNETRTTTRGRKEENEKERKENNKRKWERKKRRKKERKKRKKEKNSLCSTQVQGNKRNFYNRGFCVKMLGWFYLLPCNRLAFVAVACWSRLKYGLYLFILAMYLISRMRSQTSNQFTRKVNLYVIICLQMLSVSSKRWARARRNRTLRQIRVQVGRKAWWTSEFR